MQKAQSAVEFILLITALLLIAIPAFYLLSDYAFKSSSDVARVQLREGGQKIVDEAREMFYLGKFSKEIITVNMPDNVRSMSTLIIIGATDMEQYLIINHSNAEVKTDILIQSEVPIVTENCNYIPGCYPTKDCYSCLFSHEAFQPGIKNYKIETLPSWNSLTVVNISLIEW